MFKLAIFSKILDEEVCLAKKYVKIHYFYKLFLQGDTKRKLAKFLKNTMKILYPRMELTRYEVCTT